MPSTPEGLKDAGVRLWEAVTTRYALEQHEIVLLVQACHVADLCAELQQHLDQAGVLVTGKKAAARPRPALAELRQQRLTLARLLVALRVPLGDQEEEPAASAPRLQRRGTRGFYAINGGRT